MAENMLPSRQRNKRKTLFNKRIERFDFRDKQTFQRLEKKSELTHEAFKLQGILVNSKLIEALKFLLLLKKV